MMRSKRRLRFPNAPVSDRFVWSISTEREIFEWLWEDFG
jgi:hypothetical protein